jgi:hypothetical protein
VKTVIIDQDSKLAKVIRESRWDGNHEIDPNHAEKSLDQYRLSFPSFLDFRRL